MCLQSRTKNEGNVIQYINFNGLHIQRHTHACVYVRILCMYSALKYTCVRCVCVQEHIHR